MPACFFIIHVYIYKVFPLFVLILNASNPISDF